MDIVYKETLYSRPPITIPHLTKTKKEKTGRYEIFKDKAGEYRFRLKAANGEIIAVSEGYKEKKSCLHGIESVRRNATSIIIDELIS